VLIKDEWYNQQLVNSQSHNTKPVCSADNDQFETCLENRRPGQLEFQLRCIQLYHFTTIRRPSLNFMQLLIQYQWTENCLYDGKLADFCQWCARTRETDRQTDRHTDTQTDNDTDDHRTANNAARNVKHLWNNANHKWTLVLINLILENLPPISCLVKLIWFWQLFKLAQQLNIYTHRAITLWLHCLVLGQLCTVSQKKETLYSCPYLC